MRASAATWNGRGLRGRNVAYSCATAAAVAGAVLNMFWVFVYPIHSLITILVCLLVAYGLSVYGLDSNDDSY